MTRLISSGLFCERNFPSSEHVTHHHGRLGLHLRIQQGYCIYGNHDSNTLSYHFYLMPLPSITQAAKLSQEFGEAMQPTRGTTTPQANQRSYLSFKPRYPSCIRQTLAFHFTYSIVSNGNATATRKQPDGLTLSRVPSAKPRLPPHVI
jgi:hypothetical protein